MYVLNGALRKLLSKFKGKINGLEKAIESALFIEIGLLFIALLPRRWL